MWDNLKVQTKKDLEKTERILLERTKENQIIVNGKEYIDILIAQRRNSGKTNQERYIEIKDFLSTAILDTEQYNHWITYVADILEI